MYEDGVAAFAMFWCSDGVYRYAYGDWYTGLRCRGGAWGDGCDECYGQWNGE